MEIRFNRIEISNFCSFKEEIFDFTKYGNLVLVCGRVNGEGDTTSRRNGAGKTTLADAINWCIFGESIKNVKQEQLRNNECTKKDEVRVCLYLDTIEGIGDDKIVKQYKLIRTLVKKVASSQLFEIIDGEEKDITLGGNRSTKEFFEREIARCVSKSFSKTILMTPMKNQLFFDLSKKEKEEELSSLFQINCIKAIQKSNQEEWKSLGLINPEFKIATSLQNIDNYEQLNKQFEENRNNTIKQYKNELNTVVIPRLEVLENDDSELNSEKIDKLNNIVADNNVLINKINAKLRQIDSQIMNETILMNDFKRTIEHQKKLIQLHSSDINLVCDDCKDKLRNAHNIPSIESEIETAKNQISTCESNLTNVNANREKYQSKMDELVNQNNLIHSKLSQHLKPKMDRDNEKTRLTKRKVELETGVTSKEKEVNPYTNLIKNEKEKYELLKNEHREYLKKESFYSLVKDIVSDNIIKSKIVGPRIEYLNQYISEYLKKCDCSNFEIRFNSDLGCQVFKDGKEYKEKEFNSFSSGERARLNLVVNFAFREYLTLDQHIKTNICFIDEILDSALDMAGVKSALSLLQKFADETNQTFFVISNREETIALEDVFSKKICIEKTNNTSKIIDF